MNYNEAINYIHNTPKFSRVLGNSMLCALLGKLGNPHKKLKYIHIAGTNGKGSCAIMLSEILVRSGYRVGLFTSPYIECFNERIKVNGKMIDDISLAEITTEIKMVIETENTPVSEFALDTAIAFKYFSNQACDIVILETGLGGRLDATNVIDNSLLSIIMSIGFDHMQYLGNSLEEITTEKCGIIKQDGKVVIYPEQEETVLCVINKFCAEKNAEAIYSSLPENISDNSFIYNGKKYTLGMSGDFQKLNAVTVLEATKVLIRQGLKIDAAAVSDGLQYAFNPARMEKLHCGLIIDGAHNISAVKALCKSFSYAKPNIVLCLAMMEDKDISACVRELSTLTHRVIVTELDMPRCCRAERLAKEFKKYGITAEIIKEPVCAAKIAVKKAGTDAIALACGSLYFVGEIRKSLKQQEE